tara:strand:+ start:684 stop:959 length:276 start_codon:yes stop_codon:yes gene_type:complete
MFHGLAYFNYNSLALRRQDVERRVQKRQEIITMEANDIVQKLSKLSESSVQLAEVGRLLVEHNPRLAETLQFLISVELEDKHRRENDANKI